MRRPGLGEVAPQLGERTALEPGSPIGIDISRDELAFYSLLYWPIDPAMDKPGDQTIARIDTFCVTIDRAGHDYLRRMCPEGRYLILDEVESLPVELGKVYRLLTRS